MEFEWNIFPRIHHIAALLRSPRVQCQKWAYKPEEFHRTEYLQCRCSMTSHERKPQGECDRIAELVMIQFSESKHPVFRSTSPFSRGVLQKQRWWKMFNTLLRTQLKLFFEQIFVNQLSIYGAVSDLCDECKSCHVRTERDLFWWDNLTHCSSQQMWWKHLYLWLMILRKKIYCQSTKNEWTSCHNKIVWLSFVLMQDSWQRLMSDSTSCRKTL